MNRKISSILVILLLVQFYTLNNLPEAQATQTPPTITLNQPVVSGLSVTINGGTQPTTTGATITKIDWNWGDGQSTTGWFPQTHQYSKAGTYTVTATATDSNGQTGSATTNVTLSPQHWVEVGPRSIGGWGAGKVNTLSISSNQSVIYAGSGAGPGDSGPYSDGGVHITRNGGTHWSNINNGLTDHHVSAILMNQTDNSIALAGTWFSGIFRTNNSGVQWTQTSSDNASTFLLNGTKVFAGTSNGILSSGNFGLSWTTVVNTKSPVRVLVSSNDGQRLYAGLQNGTIMSSTDGGAHWTKRYQFSQGQIWSMAVNSTNSSIVYAVDRGSPQDLFRSKDGGTTWSLVAASLNNTQYVETDPSNSQVLFAMGGSSYKSTDGGLHFTLLSLYVDVRFTEVDSQNSNNVFVASDQGIFKSADGGSTWMSLNGDMASSLLTSGSVSSNGQTFVSAVQDYGPIVSFDSGNSWQVSTARSGEDGAALINPGDANHVYVFGVNAFNQSKDGGHNFANVTKIPPFNPSLLCSPDLINVNSSNLANVYVSSKNGVYESTDYGVTFPYNFQAGQVVAIAVSGNSLYAATPNALLYSINNGSSWSPSSTSLANIATIAIDPFNRSIVFVGNPTGLHKSSNGGQSFSQIQGLDMGTVLSPPCQGVESSYFASIGNQPYLFVGTGAGLFVSTNLGQTWRSLTYNMNATEVTSIEYANSNLYITTYGEGFLEWPNFTIPGPSAPQNLQATGSSARVTLSWQAPVSNGGSAITYYKIYRSTSPGTEVYLTTRGNVTSYTDLAVTNGTTYFYRVSSVNSIGESPQSNEASAMPPVKPSAPQNLQATGSNARVTLSWQAPATNGGSAITGYRIYKATYPSDSGTYLTGRGNVTSYTDLDVTNGVTYFYRVSALNSEGESPKSNQASAAPPTPPSAPQNLHIAAGVARLTLSWQAPSTNGGSAITGYKIYRSTNAGAETYLTTRGNVTSYTDDTVTSGQTYFYKVSAVNSVGESTLSDGAGATPFSPTPPTAPQNLHAAGGNARVTLSWQAPVSNDGPAITYYKIYRSTSPGTEVYLTTRGNVTSYTDLAVTNGITYFYKVSAVNSAGISPQSNEANTTPSTVPSAPQNLQATGAIGKVTLSWQAPASNSGSAITYYKIYRSTSPGTEVYLTTRGNVTSYTDLGVTNGNTYFYKVSALNSAGESLASNEASATPPTMPSAPQNLQATGGNARVALSWQAPASNGGSAITYYKIYKSTSPGTETYLTTRGNVTSYTDLAVTNGITYFYKVSSLNSAGESPKSNEASATPH